MVPESGPQPTINWGQCPQLEPTIQEKMNKANVITKCLEVTPVPQNLTRDTVERHREAVAACALQMEGWFTPDIRYRYEKAESEIKSKRLPGGVESKVLQYHTQCKQEAEEKYPHSTQTVIHQIQLYQACMDYFISEACGIEVRMPQQSPTPGSGQASAFPQAQSSGSFNPGFQG